MNDLAGISSKRADVAGRHTPLLRNQWYVAALSEEVTRKPMRRTILEQDIVLYRGKDGAPVALQNRCAHRSYPLHLGALNEDRIVCGYHGFEYGPDGKCALAPALNMAVDGIRIQTYPVKEIGPFIWIWTGHADRVDYDKLPEQPWFTDAGWRWRSGGFHMKANYLGMHENLQDLTHFPFVHSFAKGQLGLLEDARDAQIGADSTDKGMRDFPMPALMRQLLNFEGSVTQTGTGKGGVIPGMTYGLVTMTDSSETPKVVSRWIVHCMTPEDQYNTHYYWGASRDYLLDNEAVDKEVDDFCVTTFGEDVVALEEVEELLRRDNRPEFRERIIPTDRVGVRLMRQFAQMAKEEAEEETIQQSKVVA